MGKVRIMSQTGYFLTTVAEDWRQFPSLALEKGLSSKGDASVL